MKIISLLFVLLCCDSAFAKQPPFLFIENKGQVTDQHYQPRADIDFMLRSGGLNVFVGNGQIHYQFRKAERDQKASPDRHELVKHQVQMHRVDVELVGANLNVRPDAAQPNDYYEQYYSQLFDDKGALAHSYQKVVYRDIYPDIDWVLYIKDDKLEYEFIVKEGGNVKDIKLKYSGADELKINGDGSLICATTLGAITEQKPYCHTKEKEIASAYKLRDNVLTFDVGTYSGQLVIDPTVEWTYGCCGSFFDLIIGVTTDAQGDVYIDGATEGGNIATTGAYQSAVAGGQDGFVIKLNSSGTKLWGTFFGGAGYDRPLDIQYDNVGAIYVYGATNSTAGIASTGAHQTTYLPSDPNFYGVFLAKFNSSGSRLWSTYYGNGFMGSGTIACDQSGNVYMVGTTLDPNSIATPGSHQPTLGGSGIEVDGCLVKFDGNGVRQWGTYYGGKEADYLRGVTVDNNGNIYVSGIAGSHDNIATGGVFQTTFSGIGAGMLVKFDNNGVRQWGTYYCNAAVNSVGCDNSGNVFIAGETSDQNNIATPGAHQTTFAGGTAGDLFIARFDANGSRQWGTYLGGNEAESLENIRISPDGFLYVMGNTKSSTGVATANAYKPTYQGGSHDGFFAKFASNGMCMWSSYYGTNNTDACYDIAFDGNNIFYMSGLDPVGTYSDGFLVKFQGNSSSVAPVLSNNSIVSIYPNPNGGKFTLTCSEWDANDIALTISDALGRVVFKEVYRGKPTIDIDLSHNLKPGVYFLHAANGMNNYSGSFIFR